ncbi:MAG TPA: YidC/Oxa1 family membrane protein insertase [Polyangiaceae bacterium]|nr:YidC/Oxa1 family membrane protein insertase [Polyangiaceae bacterium]
MSLALLFETLLLEPVLAIFRAIFSFWQNHTPTLGLSLIAFSLSINFLLAPIYGEMERREAAQSERRSKIQREVERMRKHFRGRERYFYIQTIYRHYHYSPALALLGSGSLLLQILLFYTAYRFLRDEPQFTGVAFGSIPSLSEPDHLLWGLNLLPVLMTAANVASAFLHSNERRQRLQASALAGVFLVLLYSSPSALLVYWTTNNVVSLFRNLARRMGQHVVPNAWHSRWVSLSELD